MPLPLVSGGEGGGWGGLVVVAFTFRNVKVVKTSISGFIYLFYI